MLKNIYFIRLFINSRFIVCVCEAESEIIGYLTNVLIDLAHYSMYIFQLLVSGLLFTFW